MKIFVRISLFIGALIFALTAMIGFTAIAVSSRIMESTTRKLLENEAVLGADLIKVYIDGQLRTLQELSSREEVLSMNMNNFGDMFSESIDRAGFLDIAIVSPDGTAHYFKDRTTAFLGDRAYVMEAFRGKPNVSETLVISRVTQQPVLMFAVPVLNESGSLIGVLVGRMDGNALSKVTERVRFGETGYALMVNSTGTFISHRDVGMVARQYNPINAAESDAGAVPLAEAVSTMLQNDRGFLSYTLENIVTYASFVSVEGIPWKLAVTVERNEFHESIAQLTTLIVGVGLILLVIGIVMTIFISRSVTRPIDVAVGALKEMGEGDLTKRLEINSKDELGTLARYFNQTAAKIEELILAIIQRVLTLRQVSNRLSENMTLTATSIKDINASVTNVSARIIEQNASVDTSSAALMLVSQNIDTLNAEVTQQAQNVAHSASEVEKMLASIKTVADTLAENNANVKQLMEASDIGRNGLSDVAEDIRGIARESEGLLEINAVMESIASQTNLLSMNAAIEAAHAGESGKGFAVVADEIRKLAESSSEQSKTISTVLKKIKSSIDKITLSTDSVLSEFESIDGSIKTVAQQEDMIRNAMDEQREGSRLILDAIGQLQETTRKVKEGTTGMLESSKSIMKESRNLEGLSAEIKYSMDEMAIGTGNIITSIYDANEASGINKENIDTLAEEVSRFKVVQSGIVAEGVVADYVWDKTFATGNETIDNQHKTLFDALNRLLAAMRSGKAGDELKKALDFLSDYTVKHFFDEEQIQKRAAYPDYPNHHKMHESFKKTVKELGGELIMKGASEKLVSEVRQKLGNWLVTHIKGQDIKLGLYLQKKASEQS
ncbi:MAG: bacteriohemerythrin [Holosporales bacterium]|jgi:methyl-accepting chemotaxis protein|nr:bacteriohemerythrin [Holosporales bacterium]